MKPPCIVIATTFHDGGQTGHAEVLACAVTCGTDAEAVAKFTAETGYQHEAGDQIHVVRLPHEDALPAFRDVARKYSRT